MRTIRYLVITALLIMLVSTCAYAGSEDKSDKLSSSQSTTFSPGYINSVMQKARSISDQAHYSNAPMQNIENTDNMADVKLDRKVDEAAVTKVTPELKKKTGGSEAKKTPAEVAVTVEEISLPAEGETPPAETLPADLTVAGREAIQQYINGRKGESIYFQQSDVVSLGGGKYRIFWREDQYIGYNWKYTIRAQDFDSSGTALRNDPYQVATNANNMTATLAIKSAIGLSNGNVALFWQSYDYTNSKYSTQLQVLDSGGNNLLSNPYTIQNNTLNNSVSKISLLSNGNIAVMWQDYTYTPSAMPAFIAGTYSGGMKLQMFDSSGRALFTNPYSISTANYSSGKMQMFSNGGVALFWSETNSNKLMYQVFNASGQSSFPTSQVLASSTSYSTVIGNISALSNGNMFVSWYDYYTYSYKMQVLDSGGNYVYSTPRGIAYSGQICDVAAIQNGGIRVLSYDSGKLKMQTYDSSGALAISKDMASSVSATPTIKILSNGDIIAYWVGQTYSSTGGNYTVTGGFQVFDSNGTAKSASPYTFSYTSRSGDSWNSILNVTELSNGNIAVFWSENYQSTIYNTVKYQVLDSSGDPLLAMTGFVANNALRMTIDSAMVVPEGLAISWHNTTMSNYYTVAGGGYGYWETGTTFGTKALDSYGKSVSINDLKNYTPPAQPPVIQPKATPVPEPTPTVPAIRYTPTVTPEIITMMRDYDGGVKPLKISNDVVDIFKGLLANNKNIGQPDMAMPTGTNPSPIASLEQVLSAMAIPQGALTPQDMQIAAALANIMKNPTEDQKLIIDTMMSLISDVNKKQDEKGQSPDLKKAEDSLLQAVANILIAQAIPDLLKEGDIAAIRTIFKDMSAQKERIVADFNVAIEPYYKGLKEILARNMATLQLNNILSKTMSKEDLEKLQPNDIDKLLEKLRQASNRSAEEELILKQESKLKAKYVDPNKKVFEGKMKGMLEGFTARLSKILEAKRK